MQAELYKEAQSRSASFLHSTLFLVFVVQKINGRRGNIFRSKASMESSESLRIQTTVVSRGTRVIKSGLMNFE